MSALSMACLHNSGKRYPRYFTEYGQIEDMAWSPVLRFSINGHLISVLSLSEVQDWSCPDPHRQTPLPRPWSLPFVVAAWCGPPPFSPPTRCEIAPRRVYPRRKGKRSP